MFKIAKKAINILSLFILILLLLQMLYVPEVHADNFKDVPGWPEIADISASAYAVYDATADEFLLEYNMNQSLWNASTTKILTALTVVNHEMFDLDAELLVSEAATTFSSPEAARLRLKPGEIISTRDCLGGLLVESANDCAYVLAENYGGLYGYSASPGKLEGSSEGTALLSRASFVEDMNLLAKSLGAKNTNFDNPCGFDGETHQTTAYDLALLSAALLKNEVLAKYVKLAHFIPDTTNLHTYAGWSLITNTNSLVVYGTNFFQSQYIAQYNGVKTGTTPLAGNCLVGAGISHHGHQIIAVLLNGSVSRSDGVTYVNIALPVRTLLEYGAYLSGSPAKSYKEAPLPFFSQTTTEEDPVETDPIVTENESERQTNANKPEKTKKETVSSDITQSTYLQTDTSFKDPVSKRERIVIALSAVIVVAVLLMWLVYAFFHRKVKQKSDKQ